MILKPLNLNSLNRVFIEKTVYSQGSVWKFWEVVDGILMEVD